MSNENDIYKLFFELSDADSVDSSLYACLELLCQQRECPAGLVAGDNWISSTVPYASYGPQHEVDRLHEISLRHQSSDEAQAEPADRYLSIPLSLGERRVGTLWLAREDSSPWPAQVHPHITALNAVLALLIVGTDFSVSDPAQRVLSRSNLHIQLSREIARSQRNGSEFSLVLLQLDVSSSDSCAPGACSPRVLTVSLGKWLAKRLRANDAIGLIAPNILGILLPETGNVGSKIAVLRIQALLPAFIPDERNENASLQLGTWSSVARLYPHDGCDVETLVESALSGLSPASGNQSSVTGAGQLIANY